MSERSGTMMFPRATYPNSHVTLVRPERQIVKYMPLWKFESLINESALYFRRIDHFDDTFEGRIPLAVWNLNSPEIKKWYNECKERAFVCCWNLDEAESPRMWGEYANNRGVRIRTTVARLTAELSTPALPAPAPYDAAFVEMARRTGSVLAEVNEAEHDGFTVGAVDYVDFDNVDVHSVLSEGPSSVVPAFRKRHGFIPEHEFRAILRPGSASGERAQAAGSDYVLVPVSIGVLIDEICYAPAADNSLASEVARILAAGNLNIPVVRSSLAV